MKAPYAMPQELTREVFVASTVHDMKNSLSMLVNGLETSLARLDPDTFPEYASLAQMLYETQRINSFLIQALMLYKVGNGLYPFRPETQSVSDFLHLMAEQTAGLAKSKGVQVEMLVGDDLYWEFDEDLMLGVLGNAVNNALRFTHDRVLLMAVETSGVLEIRVEDNGTGFPDEMLCSSALRGDRRVNYEGGQTGLGLHFSAAAAQMHKNRGKTGEIQLTNGGALGGACFIVRLP